MKSYAAQDVQYLPEAYKLLKNVSGVFEEASKCKFYPFINSLRQGEPLPP
jgi:hypothetical protein